jgi:hypothetical protein
MANHTVPSPAGDAPSMTLPSSEEMSDSPRDRERWPALREALEICERTVNQVYQSADAEARRHQRRHRWVTAFAAVLGTFAVIFAILQLAKYIDIPKFWLASWEFAAAMIALFAVILGVVAALQRRWLLERHKAERYRLAKFGFLIDATMWSGNAAAARGVVDELQGKLAAIAALRSKALHTWASTDEIPHKAASSMITKDTLDSLVDYYLTKRLDKQIDYFSQAGRRRVRHRLLRWLPQVCFFVGVAMAFGHFGIEVYKHGQGEQRAGSGQEKPADSGNATSELLIILAAAFPVVGAGFRTFYLAFEPHRNVLRSQAKYHVLDNLKQELQGDTDAGAKFLALWDCERTMEAEHREWLRLMIEAEWFG